VKRSFFSLFFRFFRFFSFFFALNFSLHFDLVIFASKRNKAKRNSSLFFCFFVFFLTFFVFFVFLRFFHFFSLNFRFASIFSLNFCLYYLRFRFRFLVFRIEVNHVKSGFFFLFQAKRNFRFNFKGRTLYISEYDRKGEGSVEVNITANKGEGSAKLKIQKEVISD
jgi:hypothetical protein